MSCPKCDFHIHTKHLKCANETMEVPAIIKECDRLGMTAVGFTDHLNTPDKLALHRRIRRDIEELDTGVEVFFGAELNFMSCDGEFAFSEEIRDEYGFQFAIGGIHGTYLETYDLRELVDIQHRHHLKTCRDPLVDVLVHPYWFNKHEFDRNDWPWFDSMSAVPESYVRELGQVARDTGTAVEINATANLLCPPFSQEYVREYLDFLSIIAEEGATFSPGSDAHDIGHLQNIRTAWEALERLGITEDRIYQPAGGPPAPR